MKLLNIFSPSNKVDPELVEAYRSAIPSTIDIQVNTLGDSYIATVKTVNNEKLPKEIFLITEAQSPDGLISMVNDLIFSYKNIPAQYRPYYKQVLMPQGSVGKTENLNFVKAT
ncbi:MAG TPA: hypothetical protein VMV24_00005 [Candidatus Dormibacteraeota bacterium]|nr:hypothetical protein [Candidatus Dormibacteraeota bacterium]